MRGTSSTSHGRSRCACAAILAAFYSHPWAWNEIGYGGPAYPEGYMRLGPLSILEPHERPRRHLRGSGPDR